MSKAPAQGTERAAPLNDPLEGHGGLHVYTLPFQRCVRPAVLVRHEEMRGSGHNDLSWSRGSMDALFEILRGATTAAHALQYAAIITKAVCVDSGGLSVVRCDHCMRVHVKLGHCHCECPLRTRTRPSAVHKSARAPTSAQQEQLLQQIRCAFLGHPARHDETSADALRTCYLWLVACSLLGRKDTGHAHACGLIPACPVEYYAQLHTPGRLASLHTATVQCAILPGMYH